MNKKRKSKGTNPLNSQRDFFIALGAFVCSFFVRLTNLLSFPMYSDEALLLGWSKMVAENPAENLTLSIKADGYPPLTSWIYAIAFNFFSNPLFAGRFISVLAGAFSAAGVYLVGRLLFSRRAGIFATLFYIFVPMNFFIDRYAYHDSLISFFTIYTLLFSLLLLKKPLKHQPLYFLSLGITMGVGILSKTAAFLILPIPLLVWFFLKNSELKTKSQKYLKTIAGSYIFPALSYLWLFNNPHSWLILKKGRDLSISISEILSFPLAQWKTNLLLLEANLWYYLTPPLLFLSLYVLYKSIKNRNKNQLFLLTYFSLILVFFLIFSKGRIHFKYLAFAFPSLLLAIAHELDILSSTLIKRIREFKIPAGNSKFLKNPTFSSMISVFLLIIFLIPGFYFDYSLAFNPQRANFEPVDFELHFQSIFSGSKLDECVSFLRQESQKKTILVILPHPDIALLYYGLPLFLEPTPNLYFVRFGTGIYYYQNGEKHCLNFAQMLKSQLSGSEKLLAVMPSDNSNEWPELFLKGNPEAKLLKKFLKPGGKSSINVYEILY